jgi:hypothetical protein
MTASLYKEGRFRPYNWLLLWNLQTLLNPAASDKVYQFLAHGPWFSPGTPTSSTTKTGPHNIAEIYAVIYECWPFLWQENWPQQYNQTIVQTDVIHPQPMMNNVYGKLVVDLYTNKVEQYCRKIYLSCACFIQQRIFVKSHKITSSVSHKNCSKQWFLFYKYRNTRWNMILSVIKSIILLNNFSR